MCLHVSVTIQMCGYQSVCICTLCVGVCAKVGSYHVEDVILKYCGCGLTNEEVRLLVMASVSLCDHTISQISSKQNHLFQGIAPYTHFSDSMSKESFPFNKYFALLFNQ